MNPILIEIPMPIETERLILRPPQSGDGAELNEAILESFDELKPWMPWVTVRPTIEESEENVRRAIASWILREDLRISIFDKNTKRYVGGSGLHRMNWGIRKFEIGYWLRTSCVGKGYITESTNALTRYAFEQLGANRVELRFDPDNRKSIAVAERLKFEKEGRFRNDSPRPGSKELRDTLVYARFDLQGLPALNLKW